MAILIQHCQERRCRAVLLGERRAGGGESELIVERIDRLVDLRVVVGLDNGNGLARAVQRQIVDAVGGADLCRSVNDPAVCRDQLRDGIAAERQGIDNQRVRRSPLPLRTSSAFGA